MFPFCDGGPTFGWVAQTGRSYRIMVAVSVASSPSGEHGYGGSAATLT